MMKGNVVGYGCRRRAVGRVHWKTGQLVNARRTRRDRGIGPRMRKRVEIYD